MFTAFKSMADTRRFGSLNRICVSLVLLVAASGIIGVAIVRAEGKAGEEERVRATIQIRNGDKRGSGTVIASAPDQTWILTAAHVVGDAKDLTIELHRFNFSGRITGLTEGGGWPRLVAATVAAIDPASDLALVSIRGMTALPFRARFDPAAKEPGHGDILTSVGVDRGLHLVRSPTTIEGTASIDLGKGGGGKLFTVTSRPPNHGRSGGGLFRADGVLVGVCTGYFDLKPGKRVGAYASVTSIRELLRGRMISPEPASTTTHGRDG